MTTLRTISFDDRARRYRRAAFVVGIVALIALVAMLAETAGFEAAMTWTLPALTCLVLGLSAWSLRQQPGSAAPGQPNRGSPAGRPYPEQHFGRMPVRMRRSGRNCAIDAEDALHVMYLQPHETALRRLAIRYGDDHFFQDENGRWWFCEYALLDWLEQKALDGDPRALRFRRWLEREGLPRLRWFAVPE